MAFNKLINIELAQLKLILNEFFERRRKYDEWISSLGIFLSLILTIIITDFKDYGPLKALEWRLLVVICTIFSFIWLLYTIYNRLRSPLLKELIEEIKNHSKTRIQNRGIFLILNKKNDQPTKFLTYKDRSWDCYILPHSKIEDKTNYNEEYEPLKKYITSMIGVPYTNVTISYKDEMDFNSIKYSEYGKMETDYNFKFFLVDFNNQRVHNNICPKKSFNLGGRDFQWMTLDEMERDFNTGKRNLDVINHLRDNHINY